MDIATFYGWKPRADDYWQMYHRRDDIEGDSSEISMMFLKCLTVTKMLGQISEGTNAWLKLSTKHERIHHHCSVVN